MISLFSLTFLLADCLKKWISGKAFRESEYKQMTNKEKVFAVKKARAKIIELLNSTQQFPLKIKDIKIFI
jgi:hypothetical protein